MILKKLKVIFLLANICKHIHGKELDKSEVKSTDAPLHYYLMSISGLVLLIVSALVYWLDLQEEKKVEFTVFNSQYIEKESARSNSEHDFPNFNVDVMKGRTDEAEDGEEKSSERRRRRRKVDKIVKKPES
jgi:hypothetical protein